MRINCKNCLAAFSDIIFPTSCIACRRRFLEEDDLDRTCFADIFRELAMTDSYSSYIDKWALERATLPNLCLQSSYGERDIVETDSPNKDILYQLLYEITSSSFLCPCCYKDLVIRTLSSLRVFIPINRHNQGKATYPAYLSVIVSCDYVHPITALVRLLKFNSATYVCDFAGKLIGLAFFRYIESLYKGNLWVTPYDMTEFDCLVSVPLHARRYKERGYNQAELLLEELNKYLCLENLSPYIYRRKYTKRQSEMKNKQDREENLKEVFSCDNSKFKNKRVLLIDDVMTSGASITEAAKSLYAAGAKIVLALVLASNKDRIITISDEKHIARS